jgi:hypothetical protein
VVPESQGTWHAFLAESAERAYKRRVAGEWDTGLTDLARDSLIDAVGYHLVPMYSVIGPTAAALLGPVPAGHFQDAVGHCDRAIVIARVRECRWWLMGAFWGTLFQLAVVPMQWAVAKGHTLGRVVTYQMEAEAAHIDMV